MSTYYGYAEREAEDNIDWSVVGSEVTKMLQEEVTRRDTLKKELDDASREFGKVLSEAPTGTHRGANNFITGYAGDASQARLMQDRLLKSGNLKVKDYLLQRANLTDGTEGIFNVSKNFQAEFKRKADRMTKEESAKLEQTLFSLTEGFSNFNNSGAYINPTDFTVSIAKKERVKGKNGEYVYQMSKNPQDFFTVNELNTFVSTDLERFDTEKALDDVAAAAGIRNQKIRYMDNATGEYVHITISDVTGDVYNKNLTNNQKKLVDKYKEAEEDAINEILANPYTAASILTDYIGKGYDFTFDPKEAKKDEKMILLEKDPGGSGLPKVAVSSDQDKVLRETLARGIKYRLDQTYAEEGTQIKTHAARAKTPEKRREDLANSAVDSLKDIFIKDLIYGDMKKKEDALNIMKGYNEDIQKYEFRKEGGVYNLYAIVPDATSADGKKSVEMINDFNSKSPEFIAGKIIFNERANVLSKTHRDNYSAAMAATGLSLATAKKYGLTQNITNPLGSIVASGSSKQALIPSAQRNVVGKSGASFSSGKLYDNVYKNANNTSSSEAKDAVEDSYQAQPAKGSMDNNPMSTKNFQVTAVNQQNSAKIFDDNTAMVYGTNNSEVIEVRLPPEIGPSFVLPVHSSYGFKKGSKDIYEVIDKALISYYQDPNNYNPIDLQKEIKNKMGDYSGSKDYFDDFQTGYQALLKSGNATGIVEGPLPSLTAAAGTQAPFRAYDANVDDGLPDYKAKKEAYEKKSN
tara:strand:+ start:650 stop:2890 length:2241 start_codon:yes stop_codon:yes gene_type:complete